MLFRQLFGSQDLGHLQVLQPSHTALIYKSEPGLQIEKDLFFFHVSFNAPCIHELSQMGDD